MRLASRLDHIEPFYVMECAKAARQIADSPECDAAQGGEPMIYLNIGEPDNGAALKSGSPMFRKIIGSPPLAGSHSALRAMSSAVLAHSIT